MITVILMPSDNGTIRVITVEGDVKIEGRIVEIEEGPATKRTLAGLSAALHRLRSDAVNSKSS